MDTVTKTTFIVKQDADTNRKYIRKNDDELSKNHPEADKEKITGHMSADPTDSENCPVQMFDKYISKLHPNCDRLWQLPKDTLTEEDTCWFKRRPNGRDILSKFLPTLNRYIGLSQIYTIHSARATGATILGKGFFSDTHVKSVTGHTSSSALAMYQRLGVTRRMLWETQFDAQLRASPYTFLDYRHYFPLIQSCSLFNLNYHLQPHQHHAFGSNSKWFHQEAQTNLTILIYLNFSLNLRTHSQPMVIF